jgi:RloB-like protein
MPTNKPWEQRPLGRRPAETRERRRVLIVCEDTKSGCLYLKGFKIDPKRAEVFRIGTGMNTDSLVEEAIKLLTKADHASQPYSEVWCVFDRDSFPLANYCRAFQLALANRIRVAWANEAFELWYLLHFNYHNAGISRHDYKAKLKESGLEYDKSDETIYAKVKEHQGTAFKHARRLEKHWRDIGERFPERQNPSTSVHKLVEFLRGRSAAETGARIRCGQIKRQCRACAPQSLHPKNNPTSWVTQQKSYFFILLHTLSYRVPPKNLAQPGEL